MTLLNQKSYEYQDPNGTGYYQIQKVPGSGDYIAAGKTYELRPDGSKIEHNFQWDINSRSGKKIDDREFTGKYIRRELKHSNFKRSFTLGDQIDRRNPSAKFENGLLRVTLSKIKPTIPETKKIKIE